VACSPRSTTRPLRPTEPHRGVLHDPGGSSKVAARRFKEPFRTAALADSFRAELVTAARKGEAFRTLDGRPVSTSRGEADMPWFDFACKYVDMRWPRVAATTRRTHAEAMTAITAEMLANRRGMPDPAALRGALSSWAFNTVKRDECPDDVRATLQWARSHSLPVSSLRDPATLRRVLDALTLRLDGRPAAAMAVRRKRSVLSTSLEYAVELTLLDANPIPVLKWSPPATSTTVDRRRVASPVQARTLLNAVRSQQRTGGRSAGGLFRVSVLRSLAAGGGGRAAQTQPCIAGIRVRRAGD
jgi:hypothetical protein